MKEYCPAPEDSGCTSLDSEREKQNVTVCRCQNDNRYECGLFAVAVPTNEYYTVDHNYGSRIEKSRLNNSER